MLTTDQALHEVKGYIRRLDELYGEIRTWVVGRYPGAGFGRTPVELAEEATGPYRAESLDVALPGLSALRFIPRGIFMVGARGRVDVRSRFGREILVWLEAEGPSLCTTENPDHEPENVISQPIFHDVREGWAWSDSKRGQVLPLDGEVFWERILRPLSR